MKTVSATFKDKYKTLGRQLDDILYYTENNEIVYIDGEQINSLTPHFQSNILKSAMKELDIDCNFDIPKGTILTYEHGIKVRNDEVEDYRDNYEYINYGNYIVYESEKNEDTRSYRIVCYDKMLYSMVNYEAMNITYPISIRSYIGAICTHLGLTFANENDTFANYNREIQNELYLTEDGEPLGYTFRDVLDELAQVTASTICINDDDELEIRYINDTETTIDEEFLKDVNVTFGEKYGKVNSIVLSRSAEADNIYLRDEQSVLEDGLCEIKIKDNQIMNWNDRSDYLPDILNTLDGLEYYLNDFTSTGMPWYEMCDMYNINVFSNTYKCILFNNEFIRTQGVEQNVYTEMPEGSETDYKKADKTDRKLNQVYIIVDKQNQVIESVVTNVTEQNNKISQITQTVDELNSKISDIADITTSGESIMATIDLADINESEPIQLKVRPIGTNISHLLPSNTLYPSNSLILKVRTITFYNNTQHSLIFEYELPEDLLYYNDEIYDEFYLDYGDGTPQGKICQVIKKCKYNSDGTVGLLNTPEIHTYPYPSITLTQGDYTISIASYSHGYIFARLMCQNMYTTQFYTKAEVNSQINQTASEINLVVAEKLDEDEFTHAKIVEKINDNTSFVQIDADKVDISANDVLNILSGNTINLTGKNIEIESDNFTVNSEGNATMSSATITDGLLKIGNKEIFNANGVLTNLIFPCEIWGWLNENAYYQQGGGFIGFNYDFDGSVKQSFLNFTIPLPSNFVPIDARIKLRHTPVTWINPDGTQTQQGACTNMRAYVTSGLENYAGASYNSYFVIGGNPPTFTLINEIDSHDFSNSQFQEYTTENFANRLNGGNTYNISVKTTTAKPTAVTAQNAYQVLGQHTGVLNGYIQVIGYYKI